jgi:hypothetical protein
LPPVARHRVGDQRRPARHRPAGSRIDYRDHRMHQRLVSTADGGRSWRIDYTSP